MFSVIMAGGSGTRFWPASRKARPKQFLNIAGGECLLVQTCNRMAPVSHDNEMVIILGREHVKPAKETLKDRHIPMLAEPMGRNTAPCIGLGAIYAMDIGHEGPIAFLPADHFIQDEASFISVIEAGGRLAEQGGIVTLGIIPSRPETGYGYIKRTESVPQSSGCLAYPVAAFVEKPDFEKALQYVSGKNYYWNAGIFISTPKTILTEMETHLPQLFNGLKRLEKSLGTDLFEAEFEAVYRELEPVSFDYGIMEKTKEPVYVIPCDCGWSDVGSWQSLYELRQEEHDDFGNLIDQNVLLIDSENNFISSNNRKIICLGIKECLVVDTADALLIADLKKSQDIRKIVETLKKQGKEELL